MRKCIFILKESSLNIGCVFSYFRGEHENNFRLQLETLLSSDNLDARMNNDKYSPLVHLLQALNAGNFILLRIEALHKRINKLH